MNRGCKPFVWMAAMVLLAATAARANGPVEAAQKQFEGGKYREAIQGLQAALKNMPQDPAVQFWLARSHFELGDVDNAIRFGERSVELAPRISDYYYWLGQIYGEKADRERSASYARKTRKAFEKAVELDLKNLKARRSLADFHCQASWVVGGSKSKAREQIAAITAQDAIAGILAQASCDWRGDEKWDAAAAQYQRIFQLKPKAADPYFEAADFYRKRRDATGLKTATEAAARINPNDSRLLYYRGVMFTIAGDRADEAERQLQAYLKTPPRSEYPDHASAYEWLGKVYEKLGKCREARASYEKAVQLDDKLKDAKENLKRLKC